MHENLWLLIFFILIILMLSWVIWQSDEAAVAWLVGFLILALGLLLGHAFRDKFQMNKATANFLLVVGLIGLFVLAITYPVYERRKFIHVLGFGILEGVIGFAFGIACKDLYTFSGKDLYSW